MPPGRRKFSKKTLEKMAREAKAKAKADRALAAQGGEWDVTKRARQVRTRGVGTVASIKREFTKKGEGILSSGKVRDRIRAEIKRVTGKDADESLGTTATDLAVQLMSARADQKIAQRAALRKQDAARIRRPKIEQHKPKAKRRNATLRGDMRKAAKKSQGGIKTGPRGGKYREGPGGSRTYIKK